MLSRFNTFLKSLLFDSKNLENNIDYLYKRNSGSYYTGYDLAKRMVDELFSQIKNEDNYKLENKKIFEPCVGTGIFVFAILQRCIEEKMTKAKIIKIINNIYVSDINEDAINFYKNKLTAFCNDILDYKLNNSYFNEHILGYLIYNTTDINSKYKTLSDYIDFKFDIVITNPPYKNLKMDSKKYNQNMSKDFKYFYSMISKDIKSRYQYSSTGIINIYKLFIEDIICNYTNDNALISLLVASTILSDKSCESLREYIITNHKIISITKIEENNPFIDAQQSLCTLLIKKNQSSDKIYFSNSIDSKPSIVNIKNLKKIQNGNAIFLLSDYEENILVKLSTFQKIKELCFIKNLRGELDVTFGKKFISNNETQYPLIRGRHIKEYFLDNSFDEYIDPEFISTSSKSEYFKYERIACQQISNMNKQKRVIFSLIPKNHILGNSCNFISIEENIFEIDIYYMLGLLNSNVINWYFNFFNSNNHISNYEIDEFPIPLEGKQIKEISKLVREYLTNHSSDTYEKINELVNELYGIEEYESKGKAKSKKISQELFNDLVNIIPSITIELCNDIIFKSESIDSILLNLNLDLNKFDYEVVCGIIDKYKKINNNEILNHTSFKLSDLDLEMIKNVPPGGNWQYIPKETVQKSQRLIKIAKTGGRTTLYGRIDYNKPAYTITTYFNRPGNGTYVHPVHNRVISVREAARIQSFDDTYYFYGNKTSLLKQVGNAVPVLLGKAIGDKIVKKTGFNKSLDLFCGAGGLTSGFNKAGIKAVMGSDFDMSASITYKINNPESEILCGDITEDETKNKIFNYIDNHNVDIICGGPPCQGFSLAGKRFIDDPRNQLFKDYIAVVEKIRPKIVVMENVEGLLTFQNGEIYQQIIELYQSMNYKVEGRLLIASEYGVPQKRKRVIIIATRNDINVVPADLFPDKTTVGADKQITAENALKDLENVECSTDSKYGSTYTSPFTKYLLEKYNDIKKG